MKLQNLNLQSDKYFDLIRQMIIDSVCWVFITSRYEPDLCWILPILRPPAGQHQLSDIGKLTAHSVFSLFFLSFPCVPFCAAGLSAVLALALTHSLVGCSFDKVTGWHSKHLFTHNHHQSNSKFCNQSPYIHYLMIKTQNFVI